MEDLHYLLRTFYFQLKLCPKSNGIIMEAKLEFTKHISQKVGNITQGNSTIRILRPFSPLSSSLTLQKSYLSPHLGCGNCI